jgi:oligoribonuclease (3'-5' exoribonuclease)
MRGSFGSTVRYLPPISTFLPKMTGLNLGVDKIIEIAAIITNSDLEIVDPQGFERVIHCSEETMKNMGEWCTEQHRNVLSYRRTFFNCSPD